MILWICENQIFPTYCKCIIISIEIKQRVRTHAQTLFSVSTSCYSHCHALTCFSLFQTSLLCSQPALDTFLYSSLWDKYSRVSPSSCPFISSIFPSHVFDLNLNLLSSPSNPALPPTSAKCQTCCISQRSPVADLSISDSCCAVAKISTAPQPFTLTEMLEVSNPHVKVLWWRQSYKEQLFRNCWPILTVCPGVCREITRRSRGEIGFFFFWVVSVFVWHVQ